MPGPTEKQQNLTNLLRYAEEILKIGEQVVSDLSRDAVLSMHEQDIRSLEGVTLDPGDGTWIRLARLRETSPPKPAPVFDGWVEKQTASRALEQPRLANPRMLTVAAEYASELMEAGLASDNDVMPSRGAASDGMFDVLLRLEAMPEFVAAFAEYVGGEWSRWAETERPRRQSIAAYNRLYAVQQRIVALGDDVPEETIFGVGMARWNHPSGKVSIPLIESAVEVSLTPDDGSLVISPRLSAPKLCLRPFADLEIPTVGRLIQDGGEQLARMHADPDVGFSPFDKFTFEPVLRACCARLSPSAVYEPDVREDPTDRSPPVADETLRISDTWVVYVRARSIDSRCEDIRKIIDRVNATSDDELPRPAVRMTTASPDERIEDDPFDADGNIIFPTQPTHRGPRPETTGYRSAEDVASPPAARPVFFPLPSNDEQVRIVRRLEDPTADGVVVQGPPGTGKTHTIANIISHYMATGRRVLVTARTPEALSAIQEKLPAEIRDLAIAVIHSDRQGGQQLEQAVDLLSAQVRGIDMSDYRDRCIEAERRLGDLAADIERTDRAIHEYAELNLGRVSYRGRELLPMDLAIELQAERDRHAWLPDALELHAAFDPKFTDVDIDNARQARELLGSDIVYGTDRLPTPAELPDIPRLLAAHETLVRARLSEERSARGDLPFVSFGPNASIEQARSLCVWLDGLGAWLEEAKASEAWLLDLYHTLVGVRAGEGAALAALRTLCDDWTKLVAEGRGHELRGIEAPGAPPGDAPFDAAVEALTAGRKPFGILAVGKSKLKGQVESVKIEGRTPQSVLDWAAVLGWRRWQRRANDFLGRWSAAARAAGFPSLPGDWERGVVELMRVGRLVERMQALHAEAHARVALVKTLFPHGVDARRVVFHGEAAVVREALAAKLDREDSSEALRIKRCLDDIRCDPALPFHAALAELRSEIGAPDVATNDLAETWRRMLEEASRLDRLREAARELQRVAGSVAASGAEHWARKLSSEPVDGDDRWTPATWRETWDWARAAGHVHRLSNRTHVTSLSRRRAELDTEQRRLLSEIIRLRTFMGLKRSITTDIATALAKFVQQVRALGGGTGIAAERRRRAIRDAAMDAAGAVPCWILPEWRVAEQLPSELRLFDLVIIDEASQSDITALPAVVRGKKLLIVGDDRQVSPSAIGMEERTVIQLRETFLRGMPIANYLDPMTSIYDLALMMFPGTTIMLREHFRCVEPIIRFSSRLCYRRNLIPLRIPTATERLDPPLVDVYVKGGRKVRDVNEGEADFVVAEIARIAGDPAFFRRSIGVISLIGDK